jgi:hypothetical protein
MHRDLQATSSRQVGQISRHACSGCVVGVFSPNLDNGMAERQEEYSAGRICYGDDGKEGL